MRFRPCIDIHNGKVKQIVGGTLQDAGNSAADNFVSEQDAAFYSRMYRGRKLSGGHIILLNPAGSEFYEADVAQAELALRAYPGGFMLGGGITPENAERFLDLGASHVIVTSYVFSQGRIDMEHLERMRKTVGKERLVLDLSARKKDGDYYVVTDRWQRFTEQKLDKELLNTLADSCDEYLIHAVDVEGRQKGIEEEVARLLGSFATLPTTYAGGVSCMEDLARLKELGKDHVDVTVGSALDIFGGSLPFEEVCNFCKEDLEETSI